MLPTEALVDGKLLAQHLELRDQLGMAPEHELRLDPQLDRAETELLETASLELQRERAGHVCIRVAAPERERGTESLRGLGGIGLHERGRMLDRPLELDRVHVLRIGYESIAAVVADDDVADRRPKVRDVRLQRRARAGGRLVAPDAVDQRVDRNRLPHLRRQQREHRALFPASQPNVDAVAQDFEGSEDANVHVRGTIRRLVRHA